MTLINLFEEGPGKVKAPGSPITSIKLIILKIK
jgi:hypothetical protein